MNSEEENKVNLQKEKIVATFEFISNDLLSLANSTSLQKFINHPDNQTGKILQNDFIHFLYYKGIYDKARIIDSTGNEILRVNYLKGNPRQVSADSLQSKLHRYFFRNSIQLNKDEIYISPFDLNMDNKEIEIPFKPTIRFCTPVFNHKGEKAGIFILNYLGKNLIDNLTNDPAFSHGQTILANPEGYYMVHPDKRKEWGFMLESSKSHTLFNDWPEASKTIYGNSDGQFMANERLISFMTVFPHRINRFAKFLTQPLPSADAMGGKIISGKLFLSYLRLK